MVLLKLPEGINQERSRIGDIKNTGNDEDMKTIDDVEEFEKKYGCTFGFVGNWEAQKIYSAREFNKNYESIEAKKIIDGVNRITHKDKCKNKGNAVLFFNKSNRTFYFDNQKLPGQ